MSQNPGGRGQGISKNLQYGAKQPDMPATISAISCHCVVSKEHALNTCGILHVWAFIFVAKIDQRHVCLLHLCFIVCLHMQYFGACCGAGYICKFGQVP